MSPQRLEGIAVRWFWCRKNRVWSIRECGHARCKRDNSTTKFQVHRPTEEPR